MDIIQTLTLQLVINDLCESISCNKLMFADDLKLYDSVSNINDCIMLQQQIDLLQRWCLSNRLYLNIAKCKVLTFSRKTNTIFFSYVIDNTILERTETIRDLGVHFDIHLTFNVHINLIVSQAYRTYGFIFRNCGNFTDVTALSCLFFSLVRTKLEYGSLIWNPIYAQYTTAVERVQKKFLKFLSFKVDGVYPARGCNYFNLLA
uniref:Uncharacterized protein LOC114348689 n=1 Tax=Diabrotica virgifera virgifera TaxID=50390 RepID=A0A6P7HH55_DIAVI